MKQIFFVLVTFIFLINNSYAGKRSCRKWIRIGSLKTCKQFIYIKAPKVDIARSVKTMTKQIERSVKNTLEEASRLPCNVGREVGVGIKNLARESENAVNVLKNEIAKSQGINPEKIKRKIANQITSCKSERNKVQKLTKDLKRLNQDVKNYTSKNPNATYEDIEKFVQKNINDLEKVKVVSGNVSLVASNIWSYYFFGQSSMPVWASVSGPAALVAITVTAMLHSVQEEINKEKNKLVKCSNNYKKDLNEFSKEKSQYLKLIHDKQAGALISKISSDYDHLIELYFVVKHSANEEMVNEYNALKSILQNQIIEFKNKFNPKNELIIKIENSLKTLEV